MVPQLEASGLMFVGKDETGERMEVVELQENPSGHPFYAAAQVRYKAVINVLLLSQRCVQADIEDESSVGWAKSLAGAGLHDVA
jgi:hypothetical protein